MTEGKTIESEKRKEKGSEQEQPLYTVFARPPLSPLNQYIETIWYYKGYTLAHEKERLLPDGRMALVFNLGDEYTRIYDSKDPDKFETIRGAVLTGARSESFVIDTACQEHVIGIHFKPGGGRFVLGLPASEVQGSHISLESIWGARALDLRDEILFAETPEAKVAVLENRLLQRLRFSYPRHPAVAFALTQLDNAASADSVAGLSDKAGLSQRRFIQVFSEEVGLTPKLYSRIKRFQSALVLVHKGGEIDWLEVAASCGYFDQAHFIHDFKAFSGLSPSTYLKRCGEHTNHVPL